MVLLPNGSVVRLKDGEKRLLTIGVLIKNSDTNQTYDYIGCLYPEGYLSPETMFLFNNDDIEQIHYLGFSDLEEQEFRSRLLEEFEKLESTSEE
jgi:hypothetical protein